MTAVYCLIWVLISVVTTWGIMTIRTSSAIASLQRAMRKEVTYWQAETERARAQTAQIAREAATCAEAWKRGRDDAVGIMSLIMSTHEGTALAQLPAEDPANFL